MSLRHAIALPLLLVGVTALLAGCITHPQNPAATQPATAIDPQTARPDYWWDKPGVVSIEYHDFQMLWDASERALKDRLFTIDRADYRLGLLTTRPMTSKQFFEVWRRDVASAYDLEQSSLATVQRTVRFEFVRNEDGTFRATPKVVVEREARPERRITAAMQFRSASAGGVYWYALGRDEALERALAKSVEDKLH